MKRFTIFLVWGIVSFQLMACQKDDGLYETRIFDRQDELSEYIVVFGDIQFYTNYSYINLYKQSLNWIEHQIDAGMQINCILHTGDICHNPNSFSHWSYFESAMGTISQQVPYYSMIGNHDYSWDDGGHIDGRYNTLFNDYVQFPLSLENVLDQFEPGRMENVVIQNSIHGERIDLLILEFGPRKEVIEWADAYVKAHPMENFILLTHEYLEQGGGRRVNNLKMVSQLRNTSYITPDQIWERLVKCNDNILCVLCGHVDGLYALTIDTNDFGREVPQIQHNIQSEQFRFDNWLMLWEFPVHGDSASVFIYNTHTNQYYNDQQSLFKFKYRDDSKAR